MSTADSVQAHLGFHTVPLLGIVQFYICSSYSTQELPKLLRQSSYVIHLLAYRPFQTPLNPHIYFSLCLYPLLPAALSQLSLSCV